MSASSGGGVEPDAVDEINVRIVLEVSAAMCKLTLRCLGQEYRWFITKCLLRDVGLSKKLELSFVVIYRNSRTHLVMTYSTPALAITAGALVEDVSIFCLIRVERKGVCNERWWNRHLE